MRVVKPVDHVASCAASQDESEVAQDPQLMGDGRLLHLDGERELADGARPLAQAPQDADAARRLSLQTSQPRRVRVPTRPTASSLRSCRCSRSRAR